VADDWGQYVSKFDGTTGQFLLRWDVPQAFAVAVAPDGTVYVLRRTVARIDRFSAAGSPLGSFGSPGSGDGQFNDPYGIAVDAQGQVWVADTGNNRIQRFAADGTFLAKWGQFGSQVGDLQAATAIAPDAFGNVFVSDSRLDRVYRFSTTGTVLRWWDHGGPNNQPLALNYGLAVDAVGNVYTTESTAFIEKYTPSGQWLAQFGSFGTGPGQFNTVMTLAVDAPGHLFASDRILCRVTRFGSDNPVPAATTSWGAVKAIYR
jgi:DNA-binding beta-propeller fold protein YncE